MDASKARKRLKEIDEERRLLETAIVRMRGDLISGSLASRFTKCKRAGCKCGKGEPHGPFLYLSQKVAGKTKWTYLGKATEGRIANAARRYHSFRERVRELKGLAGEASECYEAISTSLLATVDELKERRVR